MKRAIGLLVLALAVSACSGAATGNTPAAGTPATSSAASAVQPSGAIVAGKSTGCGKARTLQDGSISVESDGPRSYLLKTPDNYDTNHAYRLVIAYHWGGGSAEEVVQGSGATESPFYGLWEPAKGSTIFVAPVGLGSGEDAGWANVNGVDVALTDVMLAQLQAGLCIDTGRIFSTGFSYGAAFSYAIACARPDVFRGVAILSGGQFSGCNGGTKPIAVFVSHGLGDSVVPIWQGRALRDHFVDVNGVTPQDPAEPEAGSKTHVCTTYQGSTKYPVEWCAFDGDHNPNPHDDGQSTSWTPAQVWKFISQF